MSLLGDLWSGSLTSADSPDWLVSDNDVAPVLAVLSNGIKLSLVDGSSLSRFSFLEELTNAGKDGEAMVDGELGLQGDILVSLTIESSSLGVTGEGPVNTSILDHLDGVLSSVGTVSSKREVLHTNVHIVSDDSLNVWDMKSGWANENVNLGWVELEVVENLSWEGFGEREGAIAFPVASYKISSHLIVCV